MRNTVWASVGLFVVVVGGIGVVVWGTRWLEARRAREDTFTFPGPQAIGAIPLGALYADTVARRLYL